MAEQIKFDGGSLKWQGKEFFELASNANTKAMNMAVLLVERDVKKSFGTGASRADVKIRKTKSGKFHRPSAAGFPPNVDLGALKSSITGIVKIKKLKITGFVGSHLQKLAAKADVGTDLEYGYYLEVGTSKMQPRPYLRPALQRNESKILQIFKKANGK